MGAGPRPETLSCCSSCQEPIHPKAKLCKTCKSYQDWRRHFNFSAVVLSLLVALISVISAVGPQIISWLPPLGSQLEVKQFYYSTDAIVLIVENKGNQAGLIGRVNVTLYCPGVYFHQSELDDYVHKYQPKSDPSTLPAAWKMTSTWAHRQLPVERFPRGQAAKYLSFYLGYASLNPEKAFPRVGRYPAGNFCKALYEESVRIKIAVELWDYKQTNPNVVKLPELSGGEEAFWRGFETITQGLCWPPKLGVIFLLQKYEDTHRKASGAHITAFPRSI